MALVDRLDARVWSRVCTGGLSAVLHVGVLLLILLAGGKYDGADSGDSPVSQLVLIEAPDADHRDGRNLAPLTPTAQAVELDEPLPERTEAPISALSAAITAEPTFPDMPTPGEPNDAPPSDVATVPAMFTMPVAERAALSQRLARLVEQFAKSAQSLVTWEQDGKSYSAELRIERANEGTALDRVVAQVSAAQHGERFVTHINLKRLPFSAFSQMVDRWDPMVQLHDDEIVGRFHTNSSFNVLYDSRTAPKFLGKVTTAARTFHTESLGRSREADIFRGGLETRAGRIDLPEELRPFEWAPREADARIRELTSDTRVRFFRDGSLTLRSSSSSATTYINEPSTAPLYLIAQRGVTVYVQGTLAGRVLVYSPTKIVVEGDLRYARDPREDEDAPDYLGLVCDRYIEIAPPEVTGPGDLEIHGALFAGRRFVVRDVEHRKSATLRIHGSLAAGSLSASEPRYATKIEYDGRFEKRRPPGFPSTDRYEVEEWDGRWTEAAERVADEAF